MIGATGECPGCDPQRGFGSVAGRAWSFALALGCALSVSVSSAASEPISVPIAVDVVDLPVLPEVESEVMDAATMLAIATSAEDIVTGVAKREQSLGNVASAVTVISADRLRRFGHRTVGEAIAAVAGIYLVDDRLSTRVGIRGVQVNGDFNTRILVIIDGTSVTESWSQLSGVGYDLAVAIDEIERIEVIRGPVSSIYGTNAFFGIINIITRGADGTERSWGRVTAARIGGGGVSAGFALGSAERQLRGAVSAGLRRGEQTRFFARGDESGDRYNHRDNDVGSQVSASLSGASGGTFAQLRAYTYSRTIPFAPYDSPHDRPYLQTNQQVLLDVGHAIAWSRLQLRVRLSGGLYQFDDRVSDPDLGPALLTIGQARTVGGEARVRYQILDRDRLGATAGIEASYNDTKGYFSLVNGSGDLARMSAGDQIFDLEGAYTELDAEPASWLGLTAGLRFDRHSEFSSRVSPRAAAFLSRGQRYGGKLLYAEGFRNPSTYESRFDDGADLTSNPDLDAETIRSYEVVAWARPRPAVWLRASAFHWEANNIVKQVSVHCSTCPDVPADEPLPMRLRFENRDDYDTLGIELEASYRARSGWYAFAGAALVDATVADEAAAGSPSLTGSLGISSPLLAGSMHLSSEMVVIGSRPLRESTAKSDVYPEWNLSIYVPSANGFDLTFGTRNLLGIVQQVTAAEDFDRTDPEMIVPTVPGEGRELYVRIGYAFR